MPSHPPLLSFAFATTPCSLAAVTRPCVPLHPTAVVCIHDDAPLPRPALTHPHAPPSPPSSLFAFATTCSLALPSPALAPSTSSIAPFAASARHTRPLRAIHALSVPYTQSTRHTRRRRAAHAVLAASTASSHPVPPNPRSQRTLLEPSALPYTLSTRRPRRTFDELSAPFTPPSRALNTLDATSLRPPPPSTRPQHAVRGVNVPSPPSPPPPRALRAARRPPPPSAPSTALCGPFCGPFCHPSPSAIIRRPFCRPSAPSTAVLARPPPPPPCPTAALVCPQPPSPPSLVQPPPFTPCRRLRPLRALSALRRPSQSSSAPPRCLPPSRTVFAPAVVFGPPSPSLPPLHRLRLRRAVFTPAVFFSRPSAAPSAPCCPFFGPQGPISHPPDPCCRCTPPFAPTRRTPPPLAARPLRRRFHAPCAVALSCPP
ncbi:hypothetical protein DENSPDRAFT_886233 [Dentipellis sp. KUC8613]|nr:hypothetical protein DENSPDRAFT_886233 [Dentipellis sp. KUC8613]